MRRFNGMMSRGSVAMILYISRSVGNGHCVPSHFHNIRLNLTIIFYLPSARKSCLLEVDFGELTINILSAADNLWRAGVENSQAHCCKSI